MLGILKYSFVFILGLILVTNTVLAVKCADGVERKVCPEATVGGGNPDVTVGSGNPDVTVGGTKATITIKNPLNGIDDIPDFIKKLIEIVLYVGVPLVALAIIYTGFLFVQAQGSPEKITKAKSALLYTLIGAALLLGAFVIAQAIKGTVDQLKD